MLPLLYRLFRLLWGVFVVAATIEFLHLLTLVWSSPALNVTVKSLETLFFGSIAWVLWTQLLNRDVLGRRKRPRP